MLRLLNIGIRNIMRATFGIVSGAPDGLYQVCNSRFRQQYMAILLLMMSVIYVHSTHLAVSDRTLLRQHYGVVFIPRTTAMPITGYWVHTFGIRLPDRPVYEVLHRRLNCTDVHAANATHCERVKPFLDKLQELQTDMTNVLADAMLSIERLVPHTSMAPQRQSRSWIPFIGRILKTVSGTATEGDIDKVNKALKQLQAQQANAHDQFVRTEHHLASAVKLSSQRQDALQSLVRAQRMHMAQQYSQLGNMLLDVESMVDIVPTMCDRIVRMARVLVHMTEIRTSIFNALHGSLDSYLVSHSQMASALHRIRLHLRDIHPSLYLAYRSVGEVYQIRDMLVSRVSRDIYVTIKFPIAISERPLTIYELRTFPVFMPDNSSHTTQLRTDTRAFAYDASLGAYMEFNTMPHVQHHILDITTLSENFHRITHRACVVALYSNIAVEIKKYCTFHFNLHSAVSSVIMLDASTVLFNNAPTITRRCRNSPVTDLPGCRQCIHRMTCGCSLETDDIYIPPTISKCGTFRTNDTYRVHSHVVNLAVLNQFFSEESLTELGAHTILRRPISANLPPFDIYLHDDAKDIAALDSATLDLHKAVNISLRDETVYQSRADLTAYLQSNWAQQQLSESLFSGYFSFQAILLYTTSTIALLSLGSVVILSMRLKALSVLFLNIKPSAALPVHFDYFRTSTSSVQSGMITDTPFPWSTWFQELFRIELLVALLLILSLLYIILPCIRRAYQICCKYCEVSKPKYQVWIQFPTKPQAISVPYICLDYDISCYSFHGSDTDVHVKILGCCVVTAMLNWDFTIHNNWLDVSVVLPQTIVLTWRQAKALRSLMTNGDTVNKLYVYATQLDFNIVPINFSKRIDDHTPSALSATAPAEVSECRRLYPIV